jgi:hypothetical protein
MTYGVAARKGARLSALVLLGASLTGALAQAVPCTAGALTAAGVPLMFPDQPLFVNYSDVNDPLFNGQVGAFLAYPTTEEHVAAALACAFAAGVRVAIKGGGHGTGGGSSLYDGGEFTISLAAMTNVSWEDGTIVAGGGARWSDVYTFLNTSQPGYVAVGGLCPSVGLGGYIQGGGVGPLGRAYGLAADSLVSARVVLANGTGVVTADATGPHADLFWALRGGGGGNWGVVTSFTLAVYPAAPAYTWTLTCFNATTPKQVNAVVQLVMSIAPSLPTYANVDVVIGGRFACLWSIVQGDAAVSSAVLAPLTDPPHGPLPLSNDANTHSTFASMISEYAAAHGYREFDSWPWTCRSCMTNGTSVVDPMFASSLTAVLFDNNGQYSRLCEVHLVQFGGAIANVADFATAFPWRSTAYMPYLACSWNTHDPVGDVLSALATDFFAQSMGDLGCGHASYVNFIYRGMHEFLERYYSYNIFKLVDVKRAYNGLDNGPLQFPQQVPTHPHHASGMANQSKKS